MGIIYVALEDEHGKEINRVEDSRGLLYHALPKPDDKQFPWGSTIDPYGDTTFNRRQAELLRKEWSTLIKNTTDEKTVATLKQVDELLQQCVSGIHLYVKFYGD